MPSPQVDINGTGTTTINQCNAGIGFKWKSVVIIPPHRLGQVLGSAKGAVAVPTAANCPNKLAQLDGMVMAKHEKVRGAISNRRVTMLWQYQQTWRKVFELQLPKQAATAASAAIAMETVNFFATIISCWYEYTWRRYWYLVLRPMGSTQHTLCFLINTILLPRSYLFHRQDSVPILCIIVRRRTGRPAKA